MKVGAIDFDKELDLLRYMRSQISVEKLVLRVDANGAFTPDDALGKLEKLAELELHSIEQPIAVGQLEAMKNLCAQTPLPIALDEELIGIHSLPEKRILLEYIQPQYIILKPSLHGGISGSKEWIKLAEELRIPWWMTSALESNVGLNAIAQFTATFQNNLPQGLGTGSLYVENTPSQLELKNGWMRFLPL
jgi:L-alanine-DL-glutamate epimerase-like enolase superfamily enzyme